MSAFVLTIALTFAFDLAREEENVKECRRVVAIEVTQIACLCVAFLMTACLSTSRIAATIKMRMVQQYMDMQQYRHPLAI